MANKCRLNFHQNTEEMFLNGNDFNETFQKKYFIKPAQNTRQAKMASDS